jgi:hypothetical protein
MSCRVLNLLVCLSSDDDNTGVHYSDSSDYEGESDTVWPLWFPVELSLFPILGVIRWVFLRY